MKSTPRQRECFEHYTDKTPTHWVWQGSLSGTGYPRMHVDGMTKRASHVGLDIAGIDIPEGFEVSPRCGEKLCVNPAHMEVISSAEARRRPRKPREHRVIA